MSAVHPVACGEANGFGVLIKGRLAGVTNGSNAMAVSHLMLAATLFGPLSQTEFCR